MKKCASLALVSLALAGCSPTSTPAAKTVTATVVPPTVTVTVQAAGPTPETGTPSTSVAAAQTSTPVASSSYGPNGAYAVGRAQGGLDNVIPPGRYKATGDAGMLYHCASVVCRQAEDNATSTDHVDGDNPVIVEIPSTDVAIYLWDVTLVGPVS